MESPWGALQTITGPGILIHRVYNQPEPLSLQSSLILPRHTHFGIIVAFNNRQGLPWWCRGWEGFPGSSAGKESACNAGDLGLIPGLGRSPGEGKGLTPVSWPGELHGLYRPWGRKESDTTERLSLLKCIHVYILHMKFYKSGVIAYKFLYQYFKKNLF